MNQWYRLKSLVLDEFFTWYGEEPRPGFTKATVSAWRVALEARGLGSVSINVRITAVRKLASTLHFESDIALEQFRDGRHPTNATRMPGFQLVGLKVEDLASSLNGSGVIYT